MRWIFLLAILVAFSLVDCGSRAESSDWAWGKGRESKASDAGAGTNSYLVNATTNAAEDEESLIDTIVSSTRQGRNLQQDGYNQVAADPQVRKAIEDGDDAQARHYIREKLCDLGLMACEPGIEPKRPYVQPHDLIYAQPVAIKPVGRPIPALPVRGPHGPGYGPPGPGYGPPGPGYGPPKPIPFPPGPGPIFRPPRPVPGPIYGSPKPIPPPVHEPVEHDYLPHPPIKKPVDVVVNNHGGVQQHVHHHYHHSEGGVVKPSVVVDHPSPIVPTGPLYEPGPSFGSIGTGSLYGTGPTVGPVYGGATGGPIYGGPTLGPVYGGSGPYLGQGSFYKKELSIKTPLTGNGLGSTASSTNYAEKYPSYQNPRVDGVRGLGDCVCVPFDQCLPHEVARKDGYYIDPRHNGGKNIEAITLDDVVITDGNGTVISRHAKREDSAQEIFAEVDEQEKTGEATEVVTTTEVAKDEAEEKTETRKRREAPVTKDENGNDASKSNVHPRQAFYGGQQCGPRYVCCRRPLQPHRPQYPQGGGLQCGRRHAQGVNGRIKNPVYVDGDSEFGEYPWQVAILKKDVQESVYVCGGTLIDNLHILTAAHCVKTYNGQDLRVRLGEWDVNHDVEFYPYEERDVANVHIHPEFYAGTLYNDIAVLKLTHPIDTVRSPHIAPACLPDQNSDYTGSRCWTTGWGKDAFGDYGKYQNILKEVDVPIVSFQQCQLQLQQTRLGYDYKLHPGMICAGGEEGKDACKGDGGGPLVCERGGTWQVVGIVSWGIGCGQHGVPGVYVNVAHYLNWIRHIVNNRY
ncbi:uncharacterized protein [Periplaneta americana]|uniref:uncharacterized protein isoform X3 n=1 Tax=Periplaneta americana TaxID=6978 RepID=UPI0037E98345